MGRRFGLYICITDFKLWYPLDVLATAHHCYSELSGDYWDKLSHPTITDIFAGIHAQAQAAGKGIRFLEVVYII